MKKYNVLDFTNREIECWVEEYVDEKLKREYKVIDKKGTRNRALSTVEILYVVQDRSERKYTFRFYFSEYLVEVFAQWDTAIYPLRETSDDNIALMEKFLDLYVEKFGIEYLDDFMDDQAIKETQRNEERKEKAKNIEDWEAAVKDHENNIKQLGDLRARTLFKFNSTNV